MNNNSEIHKPLDPHLAEALSTSDPLCLRHLLMERMRRKFPGGDSAPALQSLFCPKCQNQPLELWLQVPCPALHSPWSLLTPRAQPAAPAGDTSPLGILQHRLPLTGQGTFSDSTKATGELGGDIFWGKKGSFSHVSSWHTGCQLKCPSTFKIMLNP